MFSHPFYNVVHVVGLVFLMAALGGIVSLAGSDRPSDSIRRAARGFHLMGISLVLLGGFGMLARLGIIRGVSWPLWVWVKVGVWGLLSVAGFLPLRYPRTALPLLFLLPLLGGLAAYMAIYKPV